MEHLHKILGLDKRRTNYTKHSDYKLYTLTRHEYASKHLLNIHDPVKEIILNKLVSIIKQNNLIGKISHYNLH